MEAGESVSAAGEELTVAARRREALELGIRTREGVPDSSLPGWESDPDLVGLVERIDGERIALTLRGRLLANEVAIRLQS